ncbi:hypothetical protein Zmor_028330 [Zophobas morio]|uniref:Odorant receptor n=1 Tax=Zophobas morio TaxID=2755281 RepID=A0AA38M3V8_9CUCU|nr:hypothetical protein Zmor_028330 [Zophobas morio]
MDFELSSWPKDDSLWVLRVLCIDFFQLKLVKTTVVLFLMCNALFIFVQTCLFLRSFEIDYFAIYAPYYFGSFYMILSLAQTILATHLNGDALNAVQLWKIQGVDKENTEHIKMEIRITTIYAIVNGIFALLAGIAHMVPSENIKKMCFPLAIIKTYIPYWKDELCFLYMTGYILIALAMVANCNQVVYTTCHFRIQIYIVKSVMKKLLSVKTKNSKDISNMLRTKEFQKDIKTKMVFIIKRINRIIKEGVKVNKQMSIYVMLFAVCGCLLGMGALLFFLVALKLHFEFGINEYLHNGTVVLAGLSTFAAVIISGQKSEDIMEEVRIMWASFPWYVLNYENSKIYLMFLGTLTRSYKIRFTEEVSINYRLGVAIARTLFSMLSVFLQLIKLDR